MGNSKHVVFVASDKPHKYSYRAAEQLIRNHYQVELLGFRASKILDVEIQTTFPNLTDVHTITLYINAHRQKEYYAYLIGLKPKRLIFNPGTENEELKTRAENAGIVTIEACTLVMLSIGNY